MSDESKPEKQWTRIREMEMGSHDPFPEFADDVTSIMEAFGNQVGRPLVMKVSVEVHEGELNRPDYTDESDGGR